MSLFQLGDFLLHSGDRSHFKIDCDALTYEDWETIAFLIKEKFNFTNVVGISDGGTKLAQLLEQYKKEGDNLTLIVDDVLTTGASMKTIRDSIKGNSIGVVVFARGRCPYWVWPIFQMIVE